METVSKKVETAWACKDCGHIMSAASDDPPTGKCPECHATPARFDAAPIADTPVDSAVAATADYDRDEVSGNDPAALFSTSAPGVSGESVNPELKVRY